MKRKHCDFCENPITFFLKGIEDGEHLFCSKRCQRLSRLFDKKPAYDKPLHNSYSNLGNWKASQTGERLVISYDHKGTLISGIVIALICIVLGVVFYIFTKEEKFSILGPIIGTGTGALITMIVLSKSSTQKAQSNLLDYDLSTDQLHLSGGRTIQDAKQHVVFSYEHYDSTGGDFNSELNLIIDGEREEFIHHIGTVGPCEKLAIALAQAGLPVEYRVQNGKNNPT